MSEEKGSGGAMTFDEIGSALGITGGGAWMLYQSALKKMRRINPHILDALYQLHIERQRITAERYRVVR